VLARQDFSCELSGDSSLNSRPMGRIIQPLELMGARFESNEGKPPLIVHGAAEINPIVYELPVASAQVKSAILFAALGAHGRTRLRSRRCREIRRTSIQWIRVTVTTDDDLTVTLDGQRN
jgi:3-phosphoshikimate 1-carboxyvinyltransferase